MDFRGLSCVQFRQKAFTYRKRYGKEFFRYKKVSIFSALNGISYCNSPFYTSY